VTRRLAIYAAIGVAVYLIALVATLPASWIGRAIADASAERLTLRSVQGSAWTGSGRLIARSREGALLDLGRLRWTASPASLFTGKLAVDVFLDERPGARLELAPGATTLQGLDIEFPASLLASLAPGLETFGPEGSVRIRSESLRVDNQSFLGRADVEWRRIRLARTRGLELGSHVARLRGGGRKVDIELATLEGPLRVSGGGSWTRDKGLVVSGTAEPEPAASGELAPFLKSVCSEYRDGKCGFRLGP
jgi:general secretion pathway protein N